jgi:VanZ family protein
MQNDRTPSGLQKSWLAASLLSLLIVLVLTHIPNAALPRVLHKHLLDKVEHVVAYGLVAAFFLLSLPDPVRPVVLAVGLLLLAGVAVVDELTQPFFNRYASVGDYVADLTGIVLAGVIFLVTRRPRFDTGGA